jgi:glycosyltransferase involved in cell wall biosynthesis
LLPRFLASVASQTRRPDRLMLVDDGSTDGSAAIAAEFEQRYEFARVLRRPPRPPRRDRLVTADELRAFIWGVEQIDIPWDVVAKLDGDLELRSETISEIERQLELDPRLGMAGTFLSEEDASGRRERLRIRSEHVHGATKFYRRECFEQISPLPAIIGWDTMDEVKARMTGWRTQSFALPGGDPLHLRKRASYDGVARGFRRSGTGAYALGDHPLHVVLFALRQMRGSAGVTGALHYLAGWTWACVRRAARADADVRAQIRRDELRRIRRRVVRAVRSSGAEPAAAVELANAAGHDG